MCAPVDTSNRGGADTRGQNEEQVRDKNWEGTTGCRAEHASIPFPYAWTMQASWGRAAAAIKLGLENFQGYACAGLESFEQGKGQSPAEGTHMDTQPHRNKGEKSNPELRVTKLT